ncbi:hypothetical protein [Fulvivirga lutea]|uniref:Uncharacterized protein n=1 Tax=Fulvivirga lutea TaxID=2810512 RepID=A0A974WFF8_9BACT|nr:hypothetical protein [Fulvivirga lutea]QSE97483.1 hypothetical protein JR347_18190 [Fulvivirga lutea]
MDFIEYLKSKKIDPKLYEAGDQKQYLKFKQEYEQMHPNSFTSQKLFLINDLRRRYLLSEAKDSKEVNNDNDSKEVKRPIVKPKIAGKAKPVMKKPGKPVIRKQAKPIINRPKKED